MILAGKTSQVRGPTPKLLQDEPEDEFMDIGEEDAISAPIKTEPIKTKNTNTLRPPIPTTPETRGSEVLRQVMLGLSSEDSHRFIENYKEEVLSRLPKR